MRGVLEEDRFSYDGVGNRLTDIQNRSYTYNNGNELLTQNGTSFSYDANGNMVSKTDTCGTTTYQYDSENRLIGISGFTINCSPFTANYKYDSFGRRIKKTISTSTSTSTLYYVYDREDILFELDGAGNIITEYLHGPGIDEPIAMIRNNQTYYYHAVGLGSIIVITDSAGNVVQRYEYNSFGEITYQQDPNFKQPYTYTGREYDQESGLYYYRARYYDAKAGRFITQDPIGFKGGINFYSYVENNPVNAVDPWGLFTYNAPPPITLPLPPDTGDMVRCLESCLGIPLVVTGGSETSHSGGSKGPHGRGEAADFSFSKNPPLSGMKSKFMCCARKCGFVFGQEEPDPPHYHVQRGSGKGGSSGELGEPICPTECK